MPLDAEGAEHDSEREVERLEDGALLDVQLEVRRGGVQLRAGVERRVEVDAVRADRVGERDAVAIRELPQLLLVGHRARSCTRAEEAPPEPRALLVGPVHESHGHRRRPLLGDAPEHLGTCDDVEAAVEPAAVRHGVDVAADQDGPLRLAAQR